MKNPLSKSDLTAIAEIAAKLQSNINERNAENERRIAAEACWAACDTRKNELRNACNFDDDSVVQEIIFLQEKQLLAGKASATITARTYSANRVTGEYYQETLEAIGGYCSAAMESMTAEIAKSLISILGEKEALNLARQASAIRHLTTAIGSGFLPPPAVHALGRHFARPALRQGSLGHPVQ